MLVSSPVVEDMKTRLEEKLTGMGLFQELRQDDENFNFID